MLPRVVMYDLAWSTVKFRKVYSLSFSVSGCTVLVIGLFEHLNARSVIEQQQLASTSKVHGKEEQHVWALQASKSPVIACVDVVGRHRPLD
jgi:hypothetical protein